MPTRINGSPKEPKKATRTKWKYFDATEIATLKRLILELYGPDGSPIIKNGKGRDEQIAKIMMKEPATKLKYKQYPKLERISKLKDRVGKYRLKEKGQIKTSPVKLTEYQKLVFGKIHGLYANKKREEALESYFGKNYDKSMLEQLKTYRSRLQRAGGYKNSPPDPNRLWLNMHMKRVTEPQEAMKHWRGYQRYRAKKKPVLLKTAIKDIPNKAGFYVVNYKPYNLIKIGASMNLRARLGDYIAPSDGKSELAYMRFWDTNANKSKTYAHPVKRFEAIVLTKLGKKHIVPAYGLEWFNVRHLGAVLKIIKGLDKKKKYDHNSWLQKFGNSTLQAQYSELNNT